MAEFDTVKGAFLLVAIVISTMMFVVIVSILGCGYLLIIGGVSPACSPDLKDFMKELIQMSFTAAIAFAGGRLSAPSAPSPKLPDKEE